jgi:hypothetical protein
MRTVNTQADGREWENEQECVDANAGVGGAVPRKGDGARV